MHCQSDLLFLPYTHTHTLSLSLLNCNAYNPKFIYAYNRESINAYNQESIYMYNCESIYAYNRKSICPSIYLSRGILVNIINDKSSCSWWFHEQMLPFYCSYWSMRGSRDGLPLCKSHPIHATATSRRYLLEKLLFLSECVLGFGLGMLTMDAWKLLGSALFCV